MFWTRIREYWARRERRKAREIDKKLVISLLRLNARNESHCMHSIWLHVFVDPAWSNWDEWRDDSDMADFVKWHDSVSKSDREYFERYARLVFV